MLAMTAICRELGAIAGSRATLALASIEDDAYKAGMTQDVEMMALALEEARKAAAAGETPVGAVLCGADGEILAAAGNRPIASIDPTAHAEIRVLREAALMRGNYRLGDVTLYVTLEPCAMCAGAISIARVKRLVFAAEDRKGGAVLNGPRFFDQPTCHWRPEVARGAFADEASTMLTDFFKARR